MLIFSSWVEWQHVLNNPGKRNLEIETQTTKKQKEKYEPQLPLLIN